MNGFVIFIIQVFLLDNIESKKHLRIIDGRDAEENQYSYVARLEILIVNKDNENASKRAHLCTSSILTPVWTLTAAHCIDQIDKLLKKIHYMIAKSRDTELVLKRDVQLVIWFGNVRDTPSKDTYRAVVERVLHPAAKMRLLGTYPLNDVALVRTEPIIIKKYTKLSALNALSLTGHEVDLVGYGLTNSSQGRIQTTLFLKRPLQVLTVIITTCSDVKMNIMYPVLCVARACGQSSTLCPGDSGGPVFHSSGVVAINSMGILYDCLVSSEKDRSYMVGKLTPISSYLDWIYDVIKNNKTSGK